MRNLFSRFTHWYFSKDALSVWLVLLMDCSIVVGSSFFVHAMVTCASCTLAEFGSLLATFCAYLIFYIIGFKIKHTYSGVLRYSSFVDLVRLWMATIYAVSMIFILRHITNVDDYLVPLSWSELLAICIMSSLVMSFVRIMTKYLYDIYFVGASVQRVFIYGVKEGGVALAKSIQAQESKYEVTGFVSDVESDAHHLLMGVKIYVNDDKLVSRMRQKNANVLMVSPLKSDAIRNNQQMADVRHACHVPHDGVPLCGLAARGGGDLLRETLCYGGHSLGAVAVFPFAVVHTLVVHFGVDDLACAVGECPDEFLDRLMPLFKFARVGAVKASDRKAPAAVVFVVFHFSLRFLQVFYII